MPDLSVGSYYLTRPWFLTCNLIAKIPSSLYSIFLLIVIQEYDIVKL